MPAQLALTLEAVRLICTATIAERDGGRTVVCQTADQALRVFVTAVYDGHRPGRVVTGIVLILGADGTRKEFTSILAGEQAHRLTRGEQVGATIAALADRHSSYTVAR